MLTWLAPKDITFERDQIEWLLSNLYLLKIGEWPEEHSDSGYIDTAAIKKQRNKGDAYFVTPAGIAGEVDARVALCGHYAQIIYKMHCSNRMKIVKVKGVSWETAYYDEKMMSQRYRMNIDDFVILHEKLLTFISGYRRKRITFKVWVNKGKVRV